MHEPATSEASVIARRLTDARKRGVLDALTEDDFRDKVVRPLYRRLNLQHLRDTCGPDEQGKDCIFLAPDPLGGSMVIAVQTKRGAVNMAGTSPSQNLVVIDTQLKMALDVPVILSDNATRLKPAQAHLCASGKISNTAREYLFSRLESHRIKLLGSDEIIELLDRLFPEFWLGIDAERFPYVRELRRRICSADDVIKITDATTAPGMDSPILDENYVSLRLTRMEEDVAYHTKTVKVFHTQKRGGRTADDVKTSEARRTPKFVDISADALLSQSHKLALITGEGGAGKTTALRRIAMTLINEVLTGNTDTVVPVLLKAKQVAAAPSQPLTELLSTETLAISGGKSPISVDDLARGKVAVLVDALEEVETICRETVLGRLLEFHAKFPACPIVLTSRDYRSVLELPSITRFVRYWILPLGMKEADGLVKRVVDKKHIDSQVVRTTLKRLNEHHGMTLSPMLVTVFLSSSDFTKQDLPPNIAEVFKKFTEQMIGRWDERKGLSQQYEANTKDFLLRRLAFQMHASRQRSISLDDVRTLFDSELSKRDIVIDRKRLVEEVVDCSGLLRSDGTVVEWRHHLLQEYFAGRGVPSAGFFEGVVGDEWWRTPMVFYFGDKPESFPELWRIVESTGGLNLAVLFDAAITVGFAVQACYLAEVGQKTKTIAWVIESFAKAMDEFRRTIDRREGGDKAMMGLCAMLALGREAVATRTLARLPKAAAGESSQSAVASDVLFHPTDPDRSETWRIVGLLEAGELDAATEAMKTFRPANRDLIFMVHLSAAWILYSKRPEGDAKKKLEQYLRETGELIDDLRQALFKEFRTLLFQIKSGKVAPVFESDEKTERVSVLLSDQADAATADQ